MYFELNELLIQAQILKCKHDSPEHLNLNRTTSVDGNVKRLNVHLLQKKVRNILQTAVLCLNR